MARITCQDRAECSESFLSRTDKNPGHVIGQPGSFAGISCGNLTLAVLRRPRPGIIYIIYTVFVVLYW